MCFVYANVMSVSPAFNKRNAFYQQHKLKHRRLSELIVKIFFFM